MAILPIDFNITGPSQVELLGSVINYEGEIAILSRHDRRARTRTSGSRA